MHGISVTLFGVAMNQIHKNVCNTLCFSGSDNMWLVAQSYSCWLPVTDGLIAAFIGPMLVILLVSVDSLLSYHINSVCSLDCHYL